MNTCNENKWHRSALDLARVIGDDETAKLLETHAAEHLADDFTWYEEWYHVLKTSRTQTITALPHKSRRRTVWPLKRPNDGSEWWQFSEVLETGKSIQMGTQSGYIPCHEQIERADVDQCVEHQGHRETRGAGRFGESWGMKRSYGKW